MARLLLACAVLLTCASPAIAATVDDVALGETRDADIAVWGKNVAWDTGAAVVLQTADGKTRTFPADDADGMTIGPDATGRLVLVFASCSSSGVKCRLRRVDVKTGRAAFVAGIRGALSDPVLRKGILVWIDGATVRSRKLAGGRVRREYLGRESIELTGLDHDGKRFAITGQGPDDPSTETTYTDVRVGVLGKRRTERIGGLGSSQEYQAVLVPLLNATSVDVIKDDTRTFQAGSAYLRMIRYPIGRGKRTQRSFGVPFTMIAHGGGRTALVQAPGTEGCGVEQPSEDTIEEDVSTTAVPCRVVLAGSSPFGADTRRTVPEVTIARTAAAVTGTVVRRLISPKTGGTTRTVGVAGVPVRVSVAEQTKFRTTGVDGTTDASGAFSVALPAPLAKAELLGVSMSTPPRAFAPNALPVPGASGR
jgi:hypothetical protein